MQESSDSDSDSSDSSSDSDSDSDSDDKEEEKKPQNKRKADDEDVPERAKKSKQAATAEAAAANTTGATTLFVGSLSFNVDDEWLRKEFEEYGCHSARIVWDRERDRSKGFGYVEFNTADEAAAALAAKKDAEIDGRAINLDFSTPRPPRDNNNNDRAAKYGDKRSAESDTVFVANLSFDVDESILSAEAEKFGSITSLRIPTDRYVSLIMPFLLS